MRQPGGRPACRQPRRRPARRVSTDPLEPTAPLPAVISSVPTAPKRPPAALRTRWPRSRSPVSMGSSSETGLPWRTSKIRSRSAWPVIGSAMPSLGERCSRSAKIGWCWRVPKARWMSGSTIQAARVQSRHRCRVRPRPLREHRVRRSRLSSSRHSPAPCHHPVFNCNHPCSRINRDSSRVVGRCPPTFSDVCHQGYPMRQPAERSLGHRVVALIALASFVTACATPATRPLPPVARAPLPGPAPAPATPPPPPSAPTPSIGPREVPLPIPPRVETPPPTMVPQPPTAPPVPPAQRGRFVVLNFDSADIETVVHAASEIVGFNYVLAPDVRGKVTVQTSGRIPQEDVFGVLLAILEVHGFTAIRSGNLYKIIKIEGARERAVPLIVGDSADTSRSADEIITQIVPVRYATVTDLNSLLRPLISARGALIAHRETNVLVITDTASNIQRLLEIVGLVDVEVALDELSITPLRFADAADLATILNQLFASGRLRRATSPPGLPVTTPTPTPIPTPPGTPGAPAAE